MARKRGRPKLDPLVTVGKVVSATIIVDTLARGNTQQVATPIGSQFQPSSLKLGSSSTSIRSAKWLNLSEIQLNVESSSCKGTPVNKLVESTEVPKLNETVEEMEPKTSGTMRERDSTRQQLVHVEP